MIFVGTVIAHQNYSTITSNKEAIMHFGNTTGGISVDFADVLLIMNVFAIATLLGVLYIDEIVALARRLTKRLNPHTLFVRLRFRFNQYRASH